MLYRECGKTGEQVSILGFGCMRLPVIGGDPTQIDEEKAIAMIRYAIEHGVNYIDTAYPYHGTGMHGGGASEPFVAKALKDGYRERVKLATKLPSWLINSRSDMDRFLDEQLERLQTDHIDFYLLHSLGMRTWSKLKELGFADFLDKALQTGKIKHAGFSFHDRLGLFKEIVDAYDWSFCQIQYNYLDEEYQAGTAGLQYAASKGLGVVVMEPLRGGKLAANLPQPVLDMLGRAAEKRTPAEWGLRWVWNHPEVSVVLSGMGTMEQVVENIKVAERAEAKSLTAPEIAMFKQIKDFFHEKTKVNCTACGYCMPCPHGVNIPACFSMYNDYSIFGESIERLKFLYNFRLGEEGKASKCVECGLCESHCPQGIPIRAELKKLKELVE